MQRGRKQTYKANFLRTLSASRPEEEEEETRTDVCPIAKTRREMTCMEALRVVLCEDDRALNYYFSKRMKLMDQIEEEVRGVDSTL